MLKAKLWPYLIIYQFALSMLTLSQHYNYSRQGVSGITVNVFMVYLSKASTKINYSLLITRNTNTQNELIIFCLY
jgi:hypothetical protein